MESVEGYNNGDLVAFRQFDEKEVKCEGCGNFEESMNFVDQTRIARVMDFD